MKLARTIGMVLCGLAIGGCSQMAATPVFPRFASGVRPEVASTLPPLTTTPVQLLIPRGVTQAVIVEEKRYTGPLNVTADSAARCEDVATASRGGVGPMFTMKVHARWVGSCIMIVHDALGQHAGITIRVLPKRPHVVAFRYTGGQQNFVVPVGVTQLKIDAYGAGTRHARGGFVEATIPVTRGEALALFVGGMPNGRFGGFNGGGRGGGGRPNPYAPSNLGAADGGGGATDVREGGNALTNRVIVAGGGGGRGYSSFDTAFGGDGGDSVGGDGGHGSIGEVKGNLNAGARGGGGDGGSQFFGGMGGSAGSAVVGFGSPNQPAGLEGRAGALGRGGRGGDFAARGMPLCDPGGAGGGGGGGYYGGGGGGSGGSYCGKVPISGPGGGGGGGGSSYVEPAATNVREMHGAGGGFGSIVISW
jgi:hypothetical protein